MAFNWQTFRTRTLTAAVFAAVMLTGLLWNQWSFLALFSIIHFGCWWEYFQLLERIHHTRFHQWVKMGCMLAGYGLMLRLCSDSCVINGYVINLNLSLPVSLAGILLLAIGIFRQQGIHVRATGAALLGVPYISLGWGIMLFLYDGMEVQQSDTYFVLRDGVIPLAIIVSIWINDTMAYIVGSLAGKTPLSRISPKKTWEGTAGGVVLCVVVMALAAPSLFIGEWVGLFAALVGGLAFVAAVAGTFGDLLESKLKRMAGVKDSGRIMPGHGGFLDRFDSLLLATPAVFLYVIALVLFS